MPPCPACQQPASKRNGRDRRGRQKYACRPCRRTFTQDTASAFSGYRWPRDVILTAVRWYLAYPLSSRQILELLAERGIDVSHRTILDWVQAFGPRLAAEVRRRRRPIGKQWFVDEVFLFRKGHKRYLYRAIDEDGVVVDVLLREHRDTASAQAFFRQAIERTGVIPEEVVTDHHRLRHLLRDRDAVYGRDFRARAERIGIDALSTPVRSPRANALAERVIGTLRRECLDHLIVFDEHHLASVLSEFVAYYNQDRPHRSLGLQTPELTSRSVTGPTRSRPVLHGLHHAYERAA